MLDNFDYKTLIKEKITPELVEKEIKQVAEEIKECVKNNDMEEAKDLIVERTILQQIRDFISSLLN